MKKIDPNLQERLHKLIGNMGYELVGAEIVLQGRQMIFRIYIDAPNGVNINDCSLVSHQVSAMLDVEEPFQSHYALEVSSPGIDRPLFELEQFVRFIGKKVKVKLHSPVDRRRQIKGTIARVEGESIFILLDESEQEIKIPFSFIEKANVIGDVRL